jgi:REP element-mobilizing transposase RayT
VLNRGDRREPIVPDDQDRQRFLTTPGEVCGKTGWQIHALCLMPDHIHLVVETPQAKLLAGVRWFPGTFTGRSTGGTGWGLTGQRRRLSG